MYSSDKLHCAEFSIPHKVVTLQGVICLICNGLHCLETSRQLLKRVEKHLWDSILYLLYALSTDNLVQMGNTEEPMSLKLYHGQKSK